MTDKRLSQKTIYETVALMRAEVEALEAVLQSHEKELRIVLDREGPGTVKSVAYDGMPGVRLIKPQDSYVEEITSLQATINNDRERLTEKKKDLAALLKKLNGWSKKLNNLELKVFELQYLGEHPLTSSEVAKALGYSPGYVRNIQSGIGKKIDECFS